MKLNFLMMITAIALAIGVTSCSNDDEVINGAGNGTDLTKGEQTSLLLTISTPKAPSTYATRAADENATEEEITIKDVHVLIYKETPKGFLLEQVQGFYSIDDDFVPVGEAENTYKLKEDKKIATTTGAKKIFVAVNCAKLGIETPETILLISALENYKIELAEGTGILSGEGGGFPMFSDKAIETTLEGGTNNLSATVKRLVAKISVQEGENLWDDDNKIKCDGGWLTGLEFAVGNANKSSYLLQNVVNVGGGFLVQDFNWSTFDYERDFFSNAKNYHYTGVAAYGTTVEALYAPENTSETYDSDGKNLTYVSIRAKFIPDFFSSGDGERKGGDSSGTTLGTFWMVTLQSGELYYFDNMQNAENFKNANPGAVISDEYIGGYCYWRGYLNWESNADSSISGSIANKFDILRNVYYKATIRSIKGLGYPSDQGNVTESTNLTFDVKVLPWELQEEEWDL